jgi:Ca2+-binding EF-hand superfamily protein
MTNEDMKKIRHLFDQFDTNHDGYLSKGEFVFFAREVLKIFERGGSNKLFKISDLNVDEKISLEEFIKIVT